jgi:hypothetical protein
VLVTPACEQALRDRFEACKATGLPGLPRAELLVYLRAAAEALDTLAEQHGLHHLSLHPRNLFVQQSLLRVADFGLVELVWLPTGQAAGPLNARYAAPELFDGRPPFPAADQYSLALIYTEMLTGVAPRALRTGVMPFRRPVAGRPPTTRPQRFDLDLLPQPDREVILRALDPAPEQRYPNCRALVEALEAAGQAPAREELYRALPPVVLFASLFGEPAAPDTVLPAVCQLVTALLGQPEAPREVVGGENARYHHLPDGAWEYRCPLHVFPGAMRLKVDGFRQHWHARLVEQQGESYLFHLDLQAPRRLWDRLCGRARRLAIELRLGPAEGGRKGLSEALTRVWSLSGNGPEMASALDQLAPQIFESLRSYLQAGPEQRARSRRPFCQPLRAYPVLPDLELGEPLEGVARNLSLSGISFRLASRPPAEKLYLHFPQEPRAAGHALLARVVRGHAGPEGVEVGAVFPSEEDG